VRGVFRLGMDHECDERTDEQTEWPLAIARSYYNKIAF